MQDKQTDNGLKDSDEGTKPSKTPTRPNSQWATGRRRSGKPVKQFKGFARGARVK